MKELLFGCPGIPASTEPHNTLNGIKRVRELGLDAMEFEFVRSVHVKKTETEKVKKLAAEHNVQLTCHGQYWVNLTSLEHIKVQQSIQRMLDAARIVHACGGWSITWHMAFYLGQPKEQVHQRVTDHVRSVVQTLRNEDNTIWIRPETTGKPTQWGDLDECLKISQDVEGVLPCIDFSHLHARHGTMNSTEEFRTILQKIEKALGRFGLDNMHIQISGIEYGPKGEKNHLNLEDPTNDFRWKDLLSVWKEFNIKGIVIPESPNIENDGILLQKTWKCLQ